MIILKLGQVITLQWLLNERKSHIFFTLNQKLEMTTLREEGLVKAKTGQKLSLMQQKVMNVNVPEGN